MVRLTCERKLKGGKLSNTFTLTGNSNVLRFIYHKLPEKYIPAWAWNNETLSYDLVIRGKEFLEYTTELEDEFNTVTTLVGEIIREYKKIKRKEVKITDFYDDED